MNNDMRGANGATGAPWIGVDLDGTLAEYHGWKGPKHIGKPIPKMVDRVVKWMSEPNGLLVKIFTARVAPRPDGSEDECRRYIEKWLERHIYPKFPLHLREPWPVHIPIVHQKDPMMIELWDDRCVQVIPNTGERADGKED